MSDMQQYNFQKQKNLETPLQELWTSLKHLEKILETSLKHTWKTLETFMNDPWKQLKTTMKVLLTPA